MKISMVVAAAENNAIGKDGKLLWHLPKDMEFFKETTMGHHVLMGRKTLESIPERFRPLPGRVNIVLSHQAEYTAKGCKVVPTIDDAIRFAMANDEEELMVIGGSEIYRQVFDRADRIYLTRVYHTFDEADSFFPNIVSSKWHVIYREKHIADDHHKYPFEFMIIERK